LLIPVKKSGRKTWGEVFGSLWRIENQGIESKSCRFYNSILSKLAKFSGFDNLSVS
jgi:hypothetical protein